MVKSTKKFVAVFLVLMLIISTACVGSFSAATTKDETVSASLYYGDINGDNVINIVDVLIVRRFVANESSLTADQMLRADVTGDNLINVIDAIKINQYLAHVINEFPVETIVPTEPTTAPTAPTDPTTQPTTPAHCHGATVNGVDACVGDIVTYTVKLQSDKLVSGVNMKVTYTNGLKAIVEPNNIISPVLVQHGSLVTNYTPHTGEKAFYQNAVDAISAYDFRSNDAVLVKLKFKVIAQGSSSINFHMTEILTPGTGFSFDDLTDYTIDKSTVVTHVENPDPTQPTQPTVPTQPTQPTQPTDPTQPTQPTTAPADDTVINGETFAIGDTVVFTGYLKSQKIVGGVDAKVSYPRNLLQYDSSITAPNADTRAIAPILTNAGSSFVYNTTPANGESAFCFNSINVNNGFNFQGNNKELVVLKFKVIGNGTGNIALNINAIYDNVLVNGTYSKITNATTSTKVEEGTSTPPVGSGAIINGKAANIGDTVKYTAYLKTSTIVGGVTADIFYTSNVLAYSQNTVNAPTATIIPNFTAGSSFGNLYPTTGESKYRFTAANAAAGGYNFQGDDRVFVTLEFKVIGNGTANIDLVMIDLRQLELVGNDFPPINNYTIDTEVLINDQEVPTVVPTQPTTRPTQPTQPTQPPVTQQAVVNGQSVPVGGTVNYSVLLQADEVIGAIDAKVNYTPNILTATQNASFPNIQGDSPVCNYAPNNGESAIYFNVANSTNGFNFTNEKVLVTFTFVVNSVGTATISETLNEVIGLRNSSGQYPTIDATTSDSMTVSGATTTVNGQEVQIGDQVQYTFKLKTNVPNVDVVGIDAFTTYSQGILEPIESSKETMFPILSQNGSMVYNFNPIFGPTNVVRYCYADALGGCDFTSEGVMVTLTFNVVGYGAGQISTDVETLVKDTLDYTKPNQTFNTNEYTCKDIVDVI